MKAHSFVFWFMLNFSWVKRFTYKEGNVEIIWNNFISPNNTQLSKDRKNRIKNKFNNQCKCCGSTNNTTIDHIIPRALGGSNKQENLQLLCEDCNKIKTEQDSIRYNEIILGIRRDTCYKKKIWKHLAKLN